MYHHSPAKNDFFNKAKKKGFFNRAFQPFRWSAMFSLQQRRQRSQQNPNYEHPFWGMPPKHGWWKCGWANPLGIACSIQGCSLNWQQFQKPTLSLLCTYKPGDTLPSLISSASPLKNCLVSITDTLWWSDNAQTRVLNDNQYPPFSVLMLNQITTSLGNLSIYYSCQVWELATLSQTRRTGK